MANLAQHSGHRCPVLAVTLKLLGFRVFVFLSGMTQGPWVLGNIQRHRKGMSYLLASHWLAASTLGGPLNCWAADPVIVPSSEEGGRLGLPVCFAFCVRPVVTKGRFPLVTVELALARTDQAAQARQAWGPCGAATLRRIPRSQQPGAASFGSLILHPTPPHGGVKTHRLFSWLFPKALAWNILELWILW